MLRTTMCAAAAVAMSAMAAEAVVLGPFTIAPPTQRTVVGEINNNNNGDQQLAFLITPGGMMNINVTAAIAGTGDSVDLNNVDFGFDLDTSSVDFSLATTPFSTVTPSPFPGSPDGANGFLGAITTDQQFAVVFEADPAALEAVGITVTLRSTPVEPPSEIPLPATALLLAGALGGFGFVTRRRRS